MATTGVKTGSVRLYAGYLVAQAAVGVLWWAALAASPTVRSWFEMLPEKHAVMDAFIFGDLVVIIVGSLLGAWGVRDAKAWTLPIVAFTAGGLVYPTLYLLAWVSFTGKGAASLFAMVVPSTLTSWLAYQLFKARR